MATYQYQLDKLLAMERLPAARDPGSTETETAAFKADFDPKLVNIWGGVQGGILMSYIMKALIEAMAGSPHPDIRHYHVNFLSAPKGGAPFRITVRTTRRTRSFAFLEGEMSEETPNGPGTVYVRFISIFCDFGGLKGLEVRHPKSGVAKVPSQLLSDWLDPYTSDLLGHLEESSAVSSSLTAPMEACPSLWDSVGAAGSFGKGTVFGDLLDIRLASPEAAAQYANQLASFRESAKQPGKGWVAKNIAVRAGSPDKRPVDAILLSFLAETPTWSNALLPPGVLKSRGATVSVLSFTLDFFCRVPAKPWLLVRNHHHGYTGDVGIPETTVWDPDTGRMVMLGRGMAFTRMPEPKPSKM